MKQKTERSDRRPIFVRADLHSRLRAEAARRTIAEDKPVTMSDVLDDLIDRALNH